MFRLNMDIDGDLGFAKESLTPQSKHQETFHYNFSALLPDYKKGLVIIQHLHL